MSVVGMTGFEPAASCSQTNPTHYIMLYILIYNIHNFVYISLFLYQRINIFINIFYLRNCENSYKSIAEKVKENALDSFAIVCYRYIAKKNSSSGTPRRHPAGIFMPSCQKRKERATIRVSAGSVGKPRGPGSLLLGTFSALPALFLPENKQVGGSA